MGAEPHPAPPGAEKGGSSEGTPPEGFEDPQGRGVTPRAGTSRESSGFRQGSKWRFGVQPLPPPKHLMETNPSLVGARAWLGAAGEERGGPPAKRTPKPGWGTRPGPAGRCIPLSASTRGEFCSFRGEKETRIVVVPSELGISAEKSLIENGLTDTCSPGPLPAGENLPKNPGGRRKRSPETPGAWALSMTKLC